MKYILRIYRILLIIGLLLLFGWLVYKNVVVSGELFLVRDFCQESQFISNLYPEVRVGAIEKEDGVCFQRIFVEPAYFKIKVSRTFAKAKVKIVYQNPDQPIFQLGLMKRKKEPLDWNFELKLLENKIFDNLDWFAMSQEGITLWQKEKRFDSIYQFVNNVPIDQKTVTFYYRFSPEAMVDSTKVVSWNLKTPLNYVDYVISRYQSPGVVGGWQEQTAEFLVGFDYMNDHFLEFIISAPGLTEGRKEIRISRIEIELSRPPTDWRTFLIDLKNFVLRKLKTFKES